MRTHSFARWPCSIARAMDLIGDPWTPLVLREVFYGIKRFDEIQNQLGIARNTLTARLNRLVDGGLLTKDLYRSDPPRYEYVLTDMGADMFGVLAAISQWGDRWLTGAEGPPMTLHHSACDHDTEAIVVCSVCGEPLTSSTTSMRIGPGFPKALRGRADVRRRFRLDEGAPSNTSTRRRRPRTKSQQ